jgi:hypothetical protein
VRQLRSYIVRIYRQGFDKLWGTVEDPKTGSRHPFSNAAEVWELLRQPIRGVVKKRADVNPSKVTNKREESV